MIAVDYSAYDYCSYFLELFMLLLEVNKESFLFYILPESPLFIPDKRNEALIEVSIFFWPGGERLLEF